MDDLLFIIDKFGTRHEGVVCFTKKSLLDISLIQGDGKSWWYLSRKCLAGLKVFHAPTRVAKSA